MANNRPPAKNELMVTEDYAIMKKVDFNALIDKLKEKGYKITHNYNHEAVGRVVYMSK